MTNRRRYITWTAIICGIYLSIGVTLVIQPDRWSNTPSYANLLSIFPSWQWGIIYFVTGVVLVLAFVKPSAKWLYVAAHTLAIALTSAWLLAFIVRYLTDDGTTIVNVVSWTVYLSLLIQSALAGGQQHFAIVVESEK